MSNPAPALGLGSSRTLRAFIRGKTVVNLNYSSPAETMDIVAPARDLKTVITAKIFVHKLKERGSCLEILEQHFHFVYMERPQGTGFRSSPFSCNFIRARILPAWWIEFWDFKKVSLDDTAAMVSAQVPKERRGVELAHFNLISNIKQCMSVLNPTSEDVMLGYSRSSMRSVLHHDDDVPRGGIPCRVRGSDGREDDRPPCAEFKVTVMVGTGTFLRIYGTSRYVHPLMFSHLRAVWAGAEKIRDELRNLYRTKFQKGKSTGLQRTTENDARRRGERRGHSPRRLSDGAAGTSPGTVGTPLPGTQFRRGSGHAPGTSDRRGRSHPHRRRADHEGLPQGPGTHGEGDRGHRRQTLVQDGRQGPAWTKTASSP